MKIGYVTTYDAHDVGNWSGLGFFIARALEESGASVEFVGPLSTPRSASLLIKRAYHRYIGRTNYLWSRDVAAGRHYAREVGRRVLSSEVDVVMSPGTIPIAYLEVAKPVAFWTDATFRAMCDFYPGFSGLTKASLEAGDRMERAALARADLALYASEWAAASAIADYGADPDKVKVVPFGANLEHGPGQEQVGVAIASRPTDRCRLLFLGLDWERKGGAVAVEVARELNRAGLPTELSIVGTTPLGPSDVEPFIHIQGFIDKRTAQGRRRIESLLAESHFLIHPARAECYGVALCEANAFGVPCLATRVGGIPTIVRDRVNGILFEADAEPGAFVEVIGSLMEDTERYRRLAQMSYDEYLSRLNWSTSAAEVVSLLETVSAG